MHIFPCEQKVFRAGQVEIGGEPGQRPTVLVGSLFYQGHKAVVDPKVGEFDAEKVETDMQLMLEWSDKTALPVNVRLGRVISCRIGAVCGICRGTY